MSERAVNEAAEVLESQIIPQTRAAFGVERQPGLDGDARVTILHLDDAGGTVAGYFSAADAFPQAANPFSMNVKCCTSVLRMRREAKCTIK